MKREPLHPDRPDETSLARKQVAALRAIAARAAKKRAFDRKGQLFWKCSERLCGLVMLQKLTGVANVYVLAGLTPREQWGREAPKHNGEWPLSEQAEALVGPHREVFGAIVQGKYGDLEIHRIEAAMDWLFEYVDKNFLDEAAVRRSIREQNPMSPIGRRAALGGKWSIVECMTTKQK